MALARTSWRIRPLVALVILILLLVIGYAIRGSSGGDGDARHDGGPTPSAPAQQAKPTSTARSSATDQAPTSRASTSASLRYATPLSALPAQARQTWQLIVGHGPYPYAQDGVVFGNLEKHLPNEPRGYYHEYTVTTPGSDDRGARRLITGQGGQLYYTGDHYSSFVLVDTGS
ncbi:MAG: ribonuclease [Frankiales bacterium]|nr:ribonuclease [Frankiales bacterium]